MLNRWLLLPYLHQLCETRMSYGYSLRQVSQRAVTQRDIQQTLGNVLVYTVLAEFNFSFFLSALAGQKILHHRSDVLETVVLINPSDEAVSTEVSKKYFVGHGIKAPLSGHYEGTEADVVEVIVEHQSLPASLETDRLKYYFSKS